MIKTDDFNFDLPNELIAQHPTQKRDHSQLLVVDKKTGAIKDEHFYDILDEFTSNDVLVLNDTKVIPARLLGLKDETNAVIEILLLKQVSKDHWEALVKPAKRVRVGTKVIFGDNLLVAECTSVKDEGIREFKMNYSGLFIEVLEKLGTMPLPPYITEKLTDKQRYQTVYAANAGSAAAPTAGLHFTKELLAAIQDKGVKLIYLTLHVGLGTFRPVSAVNILDHKMHSESYFISDATAKQLNEAYQSQKRIIACGTTSVRSLESNFTDKFVSGEFSTNIFIYPSYQFKVVDALITNFHLPKSTLFMLVSAFSSLEIMKKAYSHAIDQKYRFFSFGDAMFIK